jgi:hypothetical protein
VDSMEVCLLRLHLQGVRHVGSTWARTLLSNTKLLPLLKRLVSDVSDVGVE